MKRILLIILISLSILSCKKEEPPIVKEYFFDNLFPTDGPSSWTYKYQNEILNCSLDLNDLRTYSVFTTVNDTNCSLFPNTDSSNKLHENEISIAIKFKSIYFSHKETFKNIRIEPNGDLYNVNIEAHEISFLLNNERFNTTYYKEQILKVNYENLSGNLDKVEYVEVNFTYKLNQYSNYSLNDKVYKDLLEVVFEVEDNHTSDYAAFQNLNFTYFIDLDEGIVGLGSDEAIYFLQD